MDNSKLLNGVVIIGNTYQVYKETAQIPFITKEQNPNFAFGYFIKNVGSSSRVFYTKLHLPKPAMNVGGTLHKDGNKSGQTVLTEKPKRLNSNAWHYTNIQLDSTDPQGEWKLELYIDNSLAKTIYFTVSSAYR